MSLQFNIPGDFSSCAAEYKKSRLLVLRSFLTEKSADLTYQQTRVLHSRRVCVTQELDMRWSEQVICENSDIYRSCGSAPVVKLMSSIGGSAAGCALSMYQCWINNYVDDEYVTPHCDVAGSIQALVCLKSWANGGNLVAVIGGREKEIYLSKGDAVLFEASKITHYTTPMRPVYGLSGRRERVTLAARYFFT